MTEFATTTVRPFPRAEASHPLPLGYDLTAVGYIEEEYLFEGVATSYRLVGERSADGRWNAEPADAAPYRTRFLVRRPIDTNGYSGTTLVEWMNVSGGLDAAPDWAYLHRHILRRGDIWVGVSVQKAGIDGGGLVEGLHLKLAAPDRYGELEHPGDAFSFDIFTQVGRLLRDIGGPSPLGGFQPARLLAVGESQSAMYLTTYINAIDPLVSTYDGYLVHGRPSDGSPIDAPTAPITSDLSTAIKVQRREGERIRDDVRVPVVVLQSETDVELLGGGQPRQPDGERLRLWEVAGAAHADTYLLLASNVDDGSVPIERLAQLSRPVSEFLGLPMGRPINSGLQQHYVSHAAYESLDRWCAGGPPPATAERLDLNDAGDGFTRDPDGIANGGLRTPWVDVPLEVLSGHGQTGELFAILFGTTEPLDSSDRERRYPGGQADYLERFTKHLDTTIENGFLLSNDRAEILGIAGATYDLLAT